MGVYLSEPQTEKNISKGQNNQFSFVSAQMQGWRKNMQDAAIHQKDIGSGNSLFAVFDGHGGFQVSKYVQKQFINVLKANKNYQKGQYKLALIQTFKNIDQLISSPNGAQQLKKIRNSSNQKSQGFNDDTIYNSTGCTANVVLITPTSYYVANAGDSRSALCRSGEIVQLSNDHKPQSNQQFQRITKAGGTISMGRVNGGLNLTRSFGDFDYKKREDLPYDKQMITCKPDVLEFQRKKDDKFIIIGCDGIWQRYVEDSSGLVNILKKDILQTNKTLQTIISQMLNNLLAVDTKDGIGCDNMSAIIVKFK